MSIWVDTRGEADTAALLLTHDVPVVREFHDSGDIGWESLGVLYGVELKSSSDLFHSLWSRQSGARLEEQLDNLRHSVDVPILGIHGIWWENYNGVDLVGPLTKTREGDGVYGRVVGHSGIQTSSADAALWRFANPDDGRPVQVINRPTKEMIIATIVHIYNNSLKEIHHTFGEFSGTRPTDNPYLNVLLSIPGLGPKRATALLERYETPIGIFRLTAKELASVEGVGLDTAQKILKAVGSG